MNVVGHQNGETQRDTAHDATAGPGQQKRVQPKAIGPYHLFELRAHFAHETQPSDGS